MKNSVVLWYINISNNKQKEPELHDFIMHEQIYASRFI